MPAILVTGASRGLGHTIATLLLAHSDTSLVVTARSSAALSALSDQYTGRVAFLAGDIASPDVQKGLAALAKEKFGGLDGMVVNHGVLDPVGKVAEVSGEDWEASLKINVLGTIGVIRECLPMLRERNGRIVLVSSGAATGGVSGWGAYGLAKAALNHLCMTLAVEEPSITSVSVRPGVVDTEMQREIREKHREAMGSYHKRFIDLHAEGKLLKPEQPGKVIANLVLRADKSLSGKFATWDDKNAFGDYQ